MWFNETNHDYLIGSRVVVEIVSLPNLGVITKYIVIYHRESGEASMVPHIQKIQITGSTWHFVFNNHSISGQNIMGNIINIAFGVEKREERAYICCVLN